MARLLRDRWTRLAWALRRISIPVAECLADLSLTSCVLTIVILILCLVSSNVADTLATLVLMMTILRRLDKWLELGTLRIGF